ncbi:MAG: IPExxxVDY family protein [Flavobacteriales bacterium]|nr:IPExxxVDY family protein [Flavobacteriales bacterium]
MASTRRPARFKLELEALPDVLVVGISSHVNDYRLCWSLNRTLGIALTKRDKDITETLRDGVARFGAYDHDDPETLGRYTLVNNRSDKGLLVKEQPQADLFLVVDRSLVKDHERLLQQVRGSEMVLAAFLLEISELRSGHKLFN